MAPHPKKERSNGDEFGTHAHCSELLQSFYLMSLITSRQMPFCASRCSIQHRWTRGFEGPYGLRRPAVGTFSIGLGQEDYGLNAEKMWRGLLTLAPCHLCRYGRTVEGAEEAKAYCLVFSEYRRCL